MDEHALERAVERIAESRAGRFEAVRLEATLERSRAQIDSLASAVEIFERILPERIGEAVQEGIHREMAAAGRSLAEMRGLLNKTLRRLDLIEEELIAERNARIDDLEILVDLVSSGWQGVDVRLSRLEGREPRPLAAPAPPPVPTAAPGYLPLAETVEAIAS
jgi:hypothetical protein